MTSHALRPFIRVLQAVADLVSINSVVLPMGKLRPLLDVHCRAVRDVLCFRSRGARMSMVVIPL